MKTGFALLILMVFSSASFANSGDKCQEAQYQQQRKIQDQKIEELSVARALEEDFRMIQQLNSKIAKLETERFDLMRANMACYASLLAP